MIKFKNAGLNFFFALLLFQGILSGGIARSTLVFTPQGLKPIETLLIGDNIVSYDSIKKAFIAVPIRQIRLYESTEAVAIQSAKKTALLVSSSQKIYVANKGCFIEANRLQAGDVLTTADLQKIIICQKVEATNQLTTFYEISLDLPHLFFAGDVPILVHNAATIAPTLIPHAINGFQKRLLRDYFSINAQNFLLILKKEKILLLSVFVDL